MWLWKQAPGEKQKTLNKPLHVRFMFWSYSVRSFLLQLFLLCVCTFALWMLQNHFMAQWSWRQKLSLRLKFVFVLLLMQRECKCLETSSKQVSHFQRGTHADTGRTFRVHTEKSRTLDCADTALLIIWDWFCPSTYRIINSVLKRWKFHLSSVFSKKLLPSHQLSNCVPSFFPRGHNLQCTVPRIASRLYFRRRCRISPWAFRTTSEYFSTLTWFSFQEISCWKWY